MKILPLSCTSTKHVTLSLPVLDFARRVPRSDGSPGGADHRGLYRGVFRVPMSLLCLQYKATKAREPKPRGMGIWDIHRNGRSGRDTHKRTTVRSAANGEWYPQRMHGLGERGRSRI